MAAPPSQISNLQSQIPRPKSFRRWFRFSLGTLFIVLTIGCLWLGWYVNRAQRQQRAVAMVKRYNGDVVYEHELPYWQEKPSYLRDRLGIDYVDNVTKIEMGVGIIYEFGGRRVHDSEFPIADSDLATLRRLPKVHTLRVSGAPITVEGCKQIATLPALEYLDVSGSQVTDAGLAHLATLKRLRFLALDECPITSEGLAHLAGHQRLDTLSLARAQLDDAGAAHLAKVPHLKVLVLQESQLTEGVLEAFAPLPLELLQIDATNATDASLAHLRNHPTLETVLVSATGVSDDGTRHLCTILHLTDLWLGETCITEACLTDLARSKTLRKLYLSGNDLSPEAVATLEKALPNCQIVAEDRR